MEKVIKNTSNLLQLSGNELTVLNLLKIHSTPLSIAKKCSIPRPTIYITLQKLQKRGLVIRKKSLNKINWYLNSDEHIEKLLFGLQRILIRDTNYYEEKVPITEK